MNQDTLMGIGILVNLSVIILSDNEHYRIKGSQPN